MSRPAPGSARADLRTAYAWCRDYTRAHQENFGVVSWILPRALRPHIFSLYSFCRFTDDLGDEAEGDRLALLADWERSLLRCYEGIREEPLLVALGHTIDRFHIPPDPFQRLIEANRMDQHITRFATWDELLNYCHHSATPVGSMVLYVLGYRDERRHALSAATCIGLQLANFWQDVTVDWEKGRVYIPREDMERFQVTEDDIAQRRVTPAFRRLIQFEVQRARALFTEGRALEPMIHRSARGDVRLFRLGGEAVLSAIESAHYDVLGRRPTISKRKKALMALTSALQIKLGL